MTVSALLDLDALAAAPVATEPFSYVYVPRFVAAGALGAIHRDFPRVRQAGSFPVDGLDHGPAFGRLIEALRGPALHRAVARAFGMDLDPAALLVTVRGLIGGRDGNIHTDSETKLVTMLVYLNLAWDHTGGRLRLLRSATDLEDYVLEIPPVDGNMVMFRRSDRSFHGHHQAHEPRFLIQVNWMTSVEARDRELKRHGRSAWLKRLVTFG